MDDKQINKWLRRRFSVLGWALLGYLAVMNGLVLLSMGISWLRQNVLAAPVEAAEDGWGYLLSIAVAAVVAYSWKGGAFWKQQLARGRRMDGFSLFCLLCLCAGAQFVNGLWISLLEWVMNCFGRSVLATLELASGPTGSFSMFLYASVFGPIAEELLFRGLILGSLRPFGKRFAILASAILFGFFHGNLLQAPFALALGLVLGYVAVEHGIFWAMGLHLFNNLVLADLLGRLLGLLPPMLGEALLAGLLLTLALCAGAILLCRRREIQSYRRSEWMDRRCIKCFFTNSGIVAFLAVTGLSMAAWLLV